MRSCLSTAEKRSARYPKDARSIQMLVSQNLDDYIFTEVGHCPDSTSTISSHSEIPSLFKYPCLSSTSLSCVGDLLGPPTCLLHMVYLSPSNPTYNQFLTKRRRSTFNNNSSKHFTSKIPVGNQPTRTCSTQRISFLNQLRKLVLRKNWLQNNKTNASCCLSCFFLVSQY